MQAMRCCTHTHTPVDTNETQQAIRDISAAVAVAVIKAAAADGHVREEGALRRLSQGDARLLHWVKRHMYSPFEYSSLAYRPPGVGE